MRLRSTALRFACSIALPSAVAISCAATGLDAQTIRGRVLDQNTEQPVPTALVRLLDPDGETRREVLADTTGAFTLSPPEEGEYYLEAGRIGYERTRTPLLALAAEGAASMDLLVRPLPIGLEGFEITAQRQAISEQAQRELQHYGLNPAALGNRLITWERIAEPPFKWTFGSILRWNPVPGLRSRGSDTAGTCYYYRRGTSLSTGQDCAIIVLNGMEITRELLEHIDPTHVELVAVLTPVEASLLYGIRGEVGAIMIWTGIGG